MELENLRYPIGRFKAGEVHSLDETKTNIQIISALPSKFINLLGSWDEEKLETPYRPDGWTIRQLIHHVADSHMNAYIRFRLALTEESPTIKPYMENLWAELPDAQTASIDLSLQLLKYLHIRLVLLLNSLSETDLQRTYEHPETGRIYPISEVIAMYAWHSEHHYQHALTLAQRNNWVA
ncbi:YfiT family bacillithiol transferase [Arundinibacter roseus]|uniref:Putative metal-dependent hydrolase n=1 Tax=Arundinibacter roseus TaxID=2070510 RepID=A0A4R4KLV3_9BACT|nr:putative metal-dependent hydrolase [Arundinibacter roseus]TDB67966.1 putative metal-dependent hydrolase [Arundinibacter roseus]